MRKLKRKRSFHHLTRADRDEIEILLGKGYVQADIARVLKVAGSTISREIGERKRKTGRYDAETAEQKARVQRLCSKYQGMKVESLPAVKATIVRMLTAYRSPDEIAGRLNREAGRTVIGKDAIYRWLYAAWGQRYAHCLCTRRRRRRTQKRTGKREMIPERIPLSMRPEEGIHGEADLFVSPRRAHTPVSVAVVCERESKYLWGKRIPNRKPRIMASAMRKMGQELSLDTVTLDNGIENKEHKGFGASAYFCDPRSPWQKPHIEQSIGLMRRWFIHKGTDLRTVPEDALQEYLGILNGKYRKSLGYRSAYEAALERGILKTKIPAEMREQKVDNVLRLRSEFTLNLLLAV